MTDKGNTRRLKVHHWALDILQWQKPGSLKIVGMSTIV